MPIYDSNGTTNSEIALLYDANGTTNTQIKEVYDANGTANTLVYNLAPGYLWNNGDVSELTGGWSAYRTIYNTANVTTRLDTGMHINITVAGNSTKAAIFRTNKAVDLSAITALHLDVVGPKYLRVSDSNTLTWGVKGMGIGLTQNPSLITEGLSWEKLTHKQNYARMVSDKDINITVDPGTITLNTAGISGSWYVCVYADIYDAGWDTTYDIFSTYSIRCSS